MKKILLSIILFLFFINSVNATLAPRNLLVVSINSENNLSVNHHDISLVELKPLVKKFVKNPYKFYYAMIDAEIKNFKFDIFTSINYYYLMYYLYNDLGWWKHEVTPKLYPIISLQCERKTSYEMYIKVSDELEKAFSELKNELSIKLYNCNYNMLSSVLKNEINNCVPKIISEADDPRNWRF